MDQVIGKIEQLTDAPPPAADITQVVSNGMDKMYAEGFELAKIRACTLIAERVAWLMKEAHAGGNWEYLKNKADEAAYMGEKIAALKLND